MTQAVSSPLVSVVIPTFRHANFVVRAIESVFEQTFPDFEIIVVNDGSPDDTAARLAPLAASGRIRYHEQANAGQAAARNAGIALARGQYIAMLDDDDLWPADKLEWQVKYLESTPQVGVIAGIAELIGPEDEARGRLGFTPSIDFHSLMLSNPICSPGQTLIRTDLLRQIGGLKVSIWGADDWDLWLRLVRLAPIVMLDRPALKYRVHPGNASGHLRRMFRNGRAVIDENLQHVPVDQRASVRRSAYASLYTFFSGRLIAQAKTDLKRGRFAAAAMNLAPLLKSPKVNFFKS